MRNYVDETNKLLEEMDEGETINLYRTYDEKTSREAFKNLKDNKTNIQWFDDKVDAKTYGNGTKKIMKITIPVKMAKRLRDAYRGDIWTVKGPIPKRYHVESKSEEV